MYGYSCMSLRALLLLCSCSRIVSVGFLLRPSVHGFHLMVQTLQPIKKSLVTLIGSCCHCTNGHMLQAACYCSLQGSQLAEIDDYFSPPGKYRIFSHCKHQSVRVKFPIECHFNFPIYYDKKMQCPQQFSIIIHKFVEDNQ